MSPFIRSCPNHLARSSERGKKTRQTEEEVGRQHQGMDRPGVRQVPEGNGEQGKMEKTGCEIIRGVPTTLAVKGLMIMIMMMMMRVLPRIFETSMITQRFVSIPRLNSMTQSVKIWQIMPARCLLVRRHVFLVFILESLRMRPVQGCALLFFGPTR